MIQSKKRTSATRFVLLTVFTYSVGFGIIMPVLPALIVELEGVTLSEATLLGGYVAAAYAVFQFLMGPLVGNLSDRFGRRPVFLLSLIGFSVDFLLMGFATNIYWLFVGRSLAGAFGAIFGPANSAMADMSTGEERAKGFGMVGAAFGIGFIVGPAIGGLLGEFGTRVPFFVAGGLAFVNFLYGWFAFPETLAEDNRRKLSLMRANPLGAFLNLRRMQGVAGLASVFLLWSIASSIYPVSWSYFAAIRYGWDSTMIGVSLTCVGISMALVQALLIGRVVARVGEQIAAVLGISAGILGFLAFAFIEDGNIALLICLLVGLQGLAQPSINAMMSQRTEMGMQGELQGFNGSLSALSALIAPLIYNTTLFYFTAGSAPIQFAGASFILAATLAACALLTMLLFNRRAAAQR